MAGEDNQKRHSLFAAFRANKKKITAAVVGCVAAYGVGVLLDNGLYSVEPGMACNVFRDGKILHEEPRLEIRKAFFKRPFGDVVRSVPTTPQLRIIEADVALKNGRRAQMRLLLCFVIPKEKLNDVLSDVDARGRLLVYRRLDALAVESVKKHMAESPLVLSALPLSQAEEKKAVAEVEPWLAKAVVNELAAKTGLMSLELYVRDLRPTPLVGLERRDGTLRAAGLSAPMAGL